MTKGRALLARGGGYLLASGASQGILFAAWACLPWAVSASDLGQFAILTFLSEICARFIVLGADSALVRYYAVVEHRNEVLRTALRWVVIGTLLVGSALLLGRSVVPLLLPGLSSAWPRLGMLVFATSVTSALTMMVLADAVGKAMVREYGWAVLLRAIVTAGGFVVVGIFRFGVAGIMAAQMSASLAVLARFFLSHRELRHASTGPSGIFRDIGFYGIPITVYSAFSLLSDYSGRLVLDRIATLSALGVYQYYFQIVAQLNGVWASLNKAWTPHVFGKLGVDRPQAIVQIVNWAYILPACYAGGVAAFLVSVRMGVPQRFVPPSYGGDITLLSLLLLGPLFTSTYSLLYPLFYFTRSTVRVSLVQALISITTIGLTAAATWRFGARGAAMGWVAGCFLSVPAYLIAHPVLMHEARSVLWLHLAWGGVGVLAGYAVAVHDASLSAAVLLAVASVSALLVRASSMRVEA